MRVRPLIAGASGLVLAALLTGCSSRSDDGSDRGLLGRLPGGGGGGRVDRE